MRRQSSVFLLCALSLLPSFALGGRSAYELECSRQNQQAFAAVQAFEPPAWYQAQTFSDSDDIQLAQEFMTQFYETKTEFLEENRKALLQLASCLGEPRRCEYLTQLEETAGQTITRESLLFEMQVSYSLYRVHQALAFPTFDASQPHLPRAFWRLDQQINNELVYPFGNEFIHADQAPLTEAEREITTKYYTLAWERIISDGIDYFLDRYQKERVDYRKAQLVSHIESLREALRTEDLEEKIRRVAFLSYPGWDQYIDSALARFRETQSERWFEVLSSFRFFSFISVQSPGPIDFVESFKEIALYSYNEEENLRRSLAKVKADSKASDDVYSLYLTDKKAIDAVIRRNPQYCSIAQKLMTLTEKAQMRNSTAVVGSLVTASVAMAIFPPSAYLAIPLFTYVDGKWIYDAHKGVGQALGTFYSFNTKISSYQEPEAVWLAVEDRLFSKALAPLMFTGLKFPKARVLKGQ